MVNDESREGEVITYNNEVERSGQAGTQLL